MFLGNSKQTFEKFLLILNGFGRDEFRDETLGRINCLSYTRLDFVATDKMGDDTKTLLFTQSFLNRLFSRYKFRKRKLAIRLRLFLCNRDQTVNLFHLITQSLSLSQFWNEASGFFKSLSDRSLCLITSNKIIHDTKSLLLNKSLLNHFFDHHKFR